MKPKFSTLRRLVTERDARRVRARGRVVGTNTGPYGTFIVRRYKGATYTEHIRP